MQSEPIKKSVDAKYVGHHWAVSRGLDAVTYSSVAESMFQCRGDIEYTREMLETSLQHFANFSSSKYGMFASLAARSWEHQSRWSIETAKHLAIVAVAGVAGTGALLQRNDSLWLSVAMVSFTIALLASLLQFWLIQKGYMKQALELDTRAGEIRDANSWNALIALEKPYIEPGRRWFLAGTITGWLSAGASMAAVILLIVDRWPF